MTAFGFELEKGPGSSRKFILATTDATLYIREPHPSKVLKPYQVRDTVDFLKREGFFK